MKKFFKNNRGYRPGDRRSLDVTARMARPALRQFLTRGVKEIGLDWWNRRVSKKDRDEIRALVSEVGQVKYREVYGLDQKTWDKLRAVADMPDPGSVSLAGRRKIERVRLPDDWLEDEANRRRVEWHRANEKRMGAPWTRDPTNKKGYGWSASFLPRLKIPYGYRFRGAEIGEVPVRYLVQLRGSRDWYRLPSRVRFAIDEYLKFGDVKLRADREFAGRETLPGGYEDLEHFKRSGRGGRRVDWKRRAPGDFGTADPWGDYASKQKYFRQIRLDLGEGQWDWTTTRKTGKEDFKSRMVWSPGEVAGGESSWARTPDEFVPTDRKDQQSRPFYGEASWLGHFDLELSMLDPADPAFAEMVRQAAYQSGPGWSDFDRLISRGMWGVDRHGRHFVIPKSLRGEARQRLHDWREWTIQDEALEILQERQRLARVPGVEYRPKDPEFPWRTMEGAPGTPQDLDLSQSRRMNQAFGDVQRDWLGRMERAQTRGELQTLIDDIDQGPGVLTPLWRQRHPWLSDLLRDKWNALA